MQAQGGYATYMQRKADRVDLAESPIDAIADALEAQIGEAQEKSRSFLEFALAIPEPQTGTLDFERFPFQREMYADAASIEEMIVMKGTQVGVSAYLIRWALYWASRGRNALYVFPNHTLMLTFSDQRVRPLIQGSDYLRRLVPLTHVNNKGHKQIGAGNVLFRGSESSDQLESNPADCLCLDEYDLLKQENIPVAEQRLSASRFPMRRRVGVPMVPQHGIAEHYLQSDQRRWNVRCSACSEWQPVSFEQVKWTEEDGRIIDPYRACQKCGKPIEDVISDGEWVATYPNRPKRGYHVTRLLRPGTTALGANLADIITASKHTTPYLMENFYRRDLGEPFVHESGRLTPEAIAAAQRDYPLVPSYAGGGLVTMGVDVASARDLNVRISLHDENDRTKGALFIGTVSSFDGLSKLMDAYDVKMCCIDHMPEMRLARSLAERYAGRVYLVRFTGPQSIKVFDVEEDLRVVTVRRTEAIDATLDMIRTQRNRLPKDPLPEGYARQLMANVREIDRDELGKTTVHYRKLAGEHDDYLFSEVYDLIAGEVWKHRQHVDEMLREHLTPLDELMEFQRSGLGDYEESSYSPGFNSSGSNDYSPGFDE